MVKMAYIIIGIALVAALSMTGAVIYRYSGIAEPANVSTPTPEPNVTLNGSGGTVTALQAFTIADNDAGVKAWEAGKSNVSLARVSADSCDAGLSDNWTLAYASDSGEVSVHVVNASVAGISPVETPERLYPMQTVQIDTLIDSDRACSISSEAMANAGMSASGPASARLAFGAGGVPVWDLSYPVGQGYYIVRMDASSGTIIGSAVVSG